jgi:hypothetical protein
MPERPPAGPAPLAVNGTRPVVLMHLVIPEATSAFTATLPGTAGSVAVTRQLTRSALPDCPRIEDLLLAVSELASNSIIHSASGQGGTFLVRVRTAPRWARAEIADQDQPRPRRNPATAGVWPLWLASPTGPEPTYSPTATASPGPRSPGQHHTPQIWVCNGAQ